MEWSYMKMKSETMPKKKKSYLSRLGMTLLTILLIVLFIFIMSLVSKIQGTARVVNYAGLDPARLHETMALLSQIFSL